MGILWVPGTCTSSIIDVFSGLIVCDGGIHMLVVCLDPSNCWFVDFSRENPTVFSNSQTARGMRHRVPMPEPIWKVAWT